MLKQLKGFKILRFHFQNISQQMIQVLQVATRLVFTYTKIRGGFFFNKAGEKGINQDKFITIKWQDDF